ncbi:uncharacterized protein KY384_006693 [Bacidia gigantensis]|uniref:uncharacterized protein n=1 Tax=Bacidia gigantensis TaxID=2732470 RepID=UPI001D04155B|nr:uncharacterized protein KY384_006693 [Bacidia gigantensis]KAG8529004.1 hypothetical protein KY384_006693 [Bacidia gigantensis]
MSQPPSPYGMLGKLPRELRDTIYSLLLPRQLWRPISFEGNPYLIQGARPGRISPPMLTLSKAIYSEVSVSFQRLVTFVYDGSLATGDRWEPLTSLPAANHEFTQNVHLKIIVDVYKYLGLSSTTAAYKPSELEGIDLNSEEKTLQRFFDSVAPFCDTKIQRRECLVNFIIYSPLRKPDVNHAAVIKEMFSKSLLVKKIQEFVAFEVVHVQTSCIALPFEDAGGTSPEFENVAQRHKGLLRDLRSSWGKTLGPCTEMDFMGEYKGRPERFVMVGEGYDSLVIPRGYADEGSEVLVERLMAL